MSRSDSSSPASAHRRILTLAWPIILSNITVPLLGLVDTAVVGHLPDSRYLAAVTLGATLFSFLYWGFGFLRMGTTGLTSQAVGRENDSDVRNLLGQSLLLAAGIGAALILLSRPLIALGLWLLDGSEVATALAAEYAEIRILSAPAVLANYAILGWFLGQQNSRVTLAILVLTNGVNIVLDLVFVVGLGMTSDGVAWATVIADYTALAFGLWLVSRQLTLALGALPARAACWRLPPMASCSRSTPTSSCAPWACCSPWPSSPPGGRPRAIPCSPPTPCCCSSSCSPATPWTASPTPPRR